MPSVKIRITADDQEGSDQAREYLKKRLPGLKLKKGQKGNNPKYASDPKILAYGELEFTVRSPPRKRRPTPASEAPAKKATAEKTAAKKSPKTTLH